jgi:hypothetical protein
MPRAFALVRRLDRRFGVVLAVLAGAQSFALFVGKPGVLSIDEVTYLAMTRSLVKAGSLGIENGVGLSSSIELEWGLVRHVGGRLVAQYPEGFAFVTAPFYALFGIGGLYVAQTIAFFGTVLACRRLARLVLRKNGTALLAAMIYACATFAWGYGAAIWPHALTALLTTTAMHEALAALGEPRPGRARQRQLLSGLLVGVATTLRLDAAFMLPALLLVPALAAPSGVASEGPPAAPARSSTTFGGAALASCPTRAGVPALATLVGTLPAWAFLSLTNHAKFGTWQPLSYGPWHPADSNTGLSRYVPLGVAGLVALVAAHVIAPRWRRLDRRHAAVAAGCVALALLVPAVREAARRELEGLYALVIDLRSRDMSWAEPGLSRSPRGAMIYIGALKKSLVQSCPFLPLALFSLAARSSDGASRRRKLAITVPVLVYVGVLSFLGWHGGLSLNLRYFGPILPFVAVLAADGIVRLARRAAPLSKMARSTDLILIAWIALYIETAVLLHLPSAALATREVFYLDVPLALASTLFVIAVLARLAPIGRARARFAAVAFVLGVAALVFGGLTALSYDAVAELRVRLRGYVVAQRAHEVIGPGPLVITEYPDPVARLFEDGAVVASGGQDDYADASRLVAEATCRHGRAYALMRRASWAKLAARSEALGLAYEVLRDSASDDLTIASLRPAKALPPACVERSGP